VAGDDLATQIHRAEERVARDAASLAFAQLADLYRKVGRLQEAVVTCRRGLARYPQYATARIILAKALAADGAVDDALAEVETVLGATPNDAGAHRLASELERQRGRIEAAVRHLEAAVALDPGDRESRTLLGLLRADPAATDASALTRVLRDDTFITPSFGAVCLEQGCTEEAVLVFTRLLTKDPQHPGAREGLENALRGRARRKG
jgi:tetratricopeptide (TPR) repeat protein